MSLPSNSIMIVEDNEIDLMLTQSLIQSHFKFCQTISSKNGNDALEKIKDYAEKFIRLPGILLVDMRLPIMNGEEFIREVQAHKLYNDNSVKIIAISASLDDENERKKLISKGINRTMVKPFDIEEFKRLIRI